MVNFYHKKLLCPDLDDLVIYGDFNAYTAQQLRVNLVKCHGRPECKSDEEIIEFLADKFLLVVYNQIRFVSDNQGR